MAYGNLRDGDAVVTSHGFIFYIFGYDHPDEGYNAFLKYVPKEHADLFDLDWLDVRWQYRGTVLLRPRDLYSPEGYPKLIESFHRAFPDYLRLSQQLDRWMITVPRRLIEEAYIPSRQLMRLMRRGARDRLEAEALKLIRLLTETSCVSSCFFGVHGSIGLGMHHEGSDIDISVYGAAHFRQVKQALMELEAEGVLTLKRESRFDGKRLNRGIFKGVDFIVNATRRFSEIKRRRQVYHPLGVIEMMCRCKSTEEDVFRPAIYEVEECTSIRGHDHSVGEISEVISMVGLYRDVVWSGESMKVRGMLEEEVEGVGPGRLRVVVGSASPGEYIDWGGS